MVDFSERADLAITLRALELIDSQQTAMQLIQLFRHSGLGRVLVIDGEVQHIEEWQALYHEPLVHLTASFVPDIREALVLGGGSLFAAAEILRYSSVERCTLVDHDPGVIEMMSRYYKHASDVRLDSRFEYVPADAVEYLQETPRSFDLIVSDCFDPLLKGEHIGLNIYSLLKARLTDEGACADVLYRHLFNRVYLQEVRRRLDTVGSYALSLVFVPEYPGILHLLSVWGKHVQQCASHPRNEIQRTWCSTAQRPNLKFYDPKFLKFYLYLPPYVRRRLEELGDERASKA